MCVMNYDVYIIEIPRVFFLFCVKICMNVLDLKHGNRTKTETLKLFMFLDMGFVL